MTEEAPGGGEALAVCTHACARSDKYRIDHSRRERSMLLLPRLILDVRTALRKQGFRSFPLLFSYLERERGG